MDYLDTLQSVKNSFTGGADWDIYHNVLKDFCEPHCDWLEIGIGDANQVMVNLKNIFANANIALNMTGVDPELDSAAFTRELFPKAELITARFEDFSIRVKYDFVSAIQSFYYFEDKPLQLERALSALKSSGKLMIVQWSEFDTLYQMNRFLFPDSTKGTSGEELAHLLSGIAGVRVTTTPSLGGVDTQRWFDSDSLLEAAIHIVSREKLDPEQMCKAKASLMSQKERWCASQLPRVNLVLVAEIVTESDE